MLILMLSCRSSPRAKHEGGFSRRATAKRPTRTYGRQSHIPSNQEEAPSTTTIRLEASEETTGSPVLPTARPTRGTILSFFKPVESCGPTVHASSSWLAGTSPDDMDDALSSSPPPRRKPRKRRRLTTRPALEPVGRGVEREREREQDRGTVRASRPSPSRRDMVQTTLSLAINPKPGFIVCKECGLLYNRLNEEDRKDHVRVHAGNRRSRLS